MKKNYRSFIAATFLALSTSSAFANPVESLTVFHCPRAENLSHKNHSIVGYGSEFFMDGPPMPVYFRSMMPVPDSVPLKLNNYSNSKTEYDGTEGIVSCFFSSTNSSESEFSISYQITNGKEGVVQFPGTDTISILIPIGLRA